MKTKISIFIFLLFISIKISAQKEFSPLSGTINSYSEITKIKDDFALYVQPAFVDQPIGIYTISESGLVKDSINMLNLPGNSAFSGTIGSFDNKLYYGGLYASTNPDIQGFSFIEFDENLNISKEIKIPSNDTLRAFARNIELSNGFVNRWFDFKVYEDTILALGSFLLFNESFQNIGNEIRYIKANFNGEIYNYQTVPSLLFNSFFLKNNFIIQGSTSTPSQLSPKPVALFNDNGDLINAWNFDNFESGEFPWGANGGEIDNQFYFSYVGYDKSLSGCMEDNLTIDVRDENFQILHRFKLNECDYLFSGNMPFTKSTDGDVFFQAVNSDFTKFIIQRYSKTMSLIWSKEFNLDIKYVKINPIKMLPTNDGGILLHCTTVENLDRKLRLFKISKEGEIISSAVETESLKNNRFNIFPNPASNVITIEGFSEVVKVDIYSLHGTYIESKTVDSNTIDISHLPNGMYILDIKTKSKSEKHKFIKIE